MPIDTSVPTGRVTGELILKHPAGFTSVTLEIPISALARTNRAIVDLYLYPACFAAIENLRRQLT